MLKPLFPGRNVIDQLNCIFEICGTPDINKWRDVHLLPDYNKVSFPKKSKKSWSDVIETTYGCIELQSLLECMIQLDPMTRSSALECLQHSWVQQTFASSHDQISSYESFRKEIWSEINIDKSFLPPPDVIVSKSSNEAKKLAIKVSTALKSLSTKQKFVGGFSDNFVSTSSVGLGGLLRDKIKGA